MWCVEAHLECVEVWSEDKHSGVEAVRPASVGSGGELFLAKQLIRVLDYQSVRVKEDTLVVLSQGPAVNLNIKKTSLHLEISCKKSSTSP